MVELFVDVAEKSDFADFEPLRSLSCRAPTSGGWCGTVRAHPIHMRIYSKAV